MDAEVSRCWNGNPAPVNATLRLPVGRPPGGQTTSIESRGTTGNKRPRIVEFGTPYNRSMSSRRRQSVEKMMMMMMIELKM
ncbi:jg9703 [Pararge aegeria aegeria]|uniref:Jg9703 protein n=1 Tax=Pararge aegeria aegeria TaxID=348720 RepID=A0A8S4SR69_9NEOP|nr:jg9703 [Pararge aegeria aegeria]